MCAMDLTLTIIFHVRNTLPIRWTKQIRVTSGIAVEGPLDDGYIWRKYGQKDILGATHPRYVYYDSRTLIETPDTLPNTDMSKGVITSFSDGVT